LSTLISDPSSVNIFICLFYLFIWKNKTIISKSIVQGATSWWIVGLVKFKCCCEPKICIKQANVCIGRQSILSDRGAHAQATQNRP
jgi:hypothetical protein